MKNISILNKNCIRSQRGLSLVELMIALTIGLVLLLGITTLIVQQSQARDELEKSSRQIENGRYAMQLLHDEIQHAGFYGQFYTMPAVPASLPDPCSTALTTKVNVDAILPLPVQGYNGALPGSSFTCALDGASAANNAQNYLTGTDILVVRRVDTNAAVPVANAVPGQVYLQTTSADYRPGTGSDTSVFTLTNSNAVNAGLADLRALVTQVYFVSPCSVPAGGGTSCTGSTDDNGRPIPTLKRLELSAVGGVTKFTVTTLVEGIENMQLDYGLDANADGYPESYAMGPASTTDWSNVMTIRVNLLARNTECTAGYADTKSYSLGGVGAVSAPASICTNGGYKRHVFSELVRAVNPSGRRAQQ